MLLFDCCYFYTLSLQGDYDLVITDYTRVKSLFGDTEIKVFIKGRLSSIIELKTKMPITLFMLLLEFVTLYMFCIFFQFIKK